MGNEIKINTQIQSYAEDFIPNALKINNFLNELSSLYSDELRAYNGEANKEISTYSSARCPAGICPRGCRRRAAGAGRSR